MIDFSSDRKRKPFIDKDNSRYNASEEDLLYSRNAHDTNVHTQLSTNFAQLRELLTERKMLLSDKAQAIIQKNKNKMEIIATANNDEIRSEARNLGDREVMEMIENAEALNGAKALIQKITSISNMKTYQHTQRDIGKDFWDKHKEREKELKMRADNYMAQSKHLKTINQKERAVFLQIERLENEMRAILLKGRRDPDHIKKASKYDQEIEKKKIVLKTMKADKLKIKKSIQDAITSIFELNTTNEQFYGQRHKELSRMFAGNDNLGEFDLFLDNLNTVISNKNKENGQESACIARLKKIIGNYDYLLEELEKCGEEESTIFDTINEVYRTNLKFAVLQKVYLSGLSNKADQIELPKKCASYRGLLADLDGDRSLIKESLDKITQMNDMLYPIRKGYETEDMRKQQLRRQIARLSQQNKQLESKVKNQRNLKFILEKLIREKEEVQVELNDCAQKNNFKEYKLKAGKLEQINQEINRKPKEFDSHEIKRQEEQLCLELQKVNERYEDIIEEIIIQESKMGIGLFIDKLEKRLCLV